MTRVEYLGNILITDRLLVLFKGGLIGQNVGIKLKGGYFMDYKRLVDNILAEQFPKQKKENILYEISRMESEIFALDELIVSLRKNSKYEYIYLKFKEQFISMKTLHNMASHKNIRLMISDIFNDYELNIPAIEEEKDEKDKLMDEIYEIIEAGLILSDNKNEVIYLQKIADELNMTF